MPSKSKRRIVFFWNNFGPMHADRVDAVAQHFAERAECLGLELYSEAPQYAWESESRASFEKTTLFETKRKPGGFSRFVALVKSIPKMRAQTWFLCHYERPDVLALAFVLRLTGHRVFTMVDSKFDDFPRRAWREVLKTFFILPYNGALSAGRRSADYLSFLGLRRHPVGGDYDTLSIDRIRHLSEAMPAPSGLPYHERDFIVVARMVAKKNLPLALEAFAKFTKQSPNARRMHFCGSGPLESELAAHAERLGISERVVFHGFLQTADVSRLLAQGLALVLPSIEEQFGLVVIEAQAMGLPVLISEVAGARDALVRNWQNGFVFEPDNPEGLAQFMALVDRDEALWRRLCEGATATAPQGDVARFAEAVETLIGKMEG